MNLIYSLLHQYNTVHIIGYIVVSTLLWDYILAHAACCQLAKSTHMHMCAFTTEVNKNFLSASLGYIVYSYYNFADNFSYIHYTLQVCIALYCGHSAHFISLAQALHNNLKNMCNKCVYARLYRMHYSAFGAHMLTHHNYISWCANF